MKHPFEYQAPTPDMVERIDAVRKSCAALYELIEATVPMSASRSLSITHLEEVSMFANKAIVFDGEGYPK